VIAGQLAFDVILEGSGRSAVAVMGSLKGGGTFTLQDGRIARLDPAAFDAIIRHVDQGLPIDTARIRDRMESALGNGGLNLPLAEGEITVAAGQARLNSIMVRTERADLALSAAFDLAGSTLDARVTLLGPAGAGGASTGRPEIGISLKGPVDAPRRTLEVAALASWLALRAVEQQARKLELLESGRDLPAGPPPPAAIPPAPAPTAAEPPPTITVPELPPNPIRIRPPAVPDAPAAPRVRPVATPDAPAAPARARPAPPPAAAAPAAPAAQAAPPLPPALDLRPAPAPRGRSEGGAVRTEAPRPPPPSTNSLFERLFGP
jgi:large subunit ribosomal protein L24